MLRLASTVGMALAVANLRRRLRVLAVRAGYGVAGTIVLVFALAFILVTAHLGLSRLVDPIASAAIIGFALLFLGVVLLFVASRPRREQSRAVEHPVGQMGSLLSDGIKHLSSTSATEPNPLRNPVFQVSLLALAAGFFLGRRRPRD
jgi:hypothetical protein